MSTFLKRFWKNESGATATDYRIIAATVVIVLIFAFGFIGYYLTHTRAITADQPEASQLVPPSYDDKHTP